MRTTRSQSWRSNNWDRKRRGFQTPDLGNQEKYIVKYFGKGLHYQAGYGPWAKHEDKPIA